MSFNQNTKINNLYQLISQITVDISGNLSNPLTENLYANDFSIVDADNISTNSITVGDYLLYADPINQRIGINTSSPEYTFDINGETRITTDKVKIGRSTGQFNQGVNGIAIGNYAAQDTQELNAIAIGYSAGQNTQGESAISIGNAAGNCNQYLNGIAIGRDAGFQSQGTNGISIGYNSGKFGQKISGIAIGTQAGENTQGLYGVAIGNSAGFLSQGERAVAIGTSAGENNQGTYAVAIGNSAGDVSQGERSVAIGLSAGSTNQGERSVAIGNTAGGSNQGDYAISVGYLSGALLQGAYGVSIGNRAGYSNQKERAIAIGDLAGISTQGTQAVAIGYNCAPTNQGQQSLAIGQNITSTFANSICVNTTGTQLVSDGSGRCFVKPIRNATNNNSLYYNNTTGEITYSSLIQGSTKNILCMTSPAYTSHLATIDCGLGNNVTKYGNLLQSMLSKTVYNNFQGSLCGTTLDTVNKRFNINETGRYLFTYNGGLIAGGNPYGNLVLDIFINNNKYINIASQVAYCSTGATFFDNFSPGTGSLCYLTFTLNPGDFIDIRARQGQEPVPATTAYYILAGTTITLEKIE